MPPGGRRRIAAAFAPWTRAVQRFDHRRLMAALPLPPLLLGLALVAGAAAPPEPVAVVRVDLSEQQLTAFDGAGRMLYRALVSTGRPATPTPVGHFTVGTKYEETTMTGTDYVVPSVRHVMCLLGDGLRPDAVCIHPAPWQESAGERFGVPRSHGCVRTSSATARWLFLRTAVGTPVLVEP